LLVNSRKSARRSRLVGGRKPSDLRKGFRVSGFWGSGGVIFADEQKQRAPESVRRGQKTQRPERENQGFMVFCFCGFVVILAGDEQKERAEATWWGIGTQAT
jgi:hypothetical protein